MLSLVLLSALKLGACRVHRPCQLLKAGSSGVVVWCTVSFRQIGSAVFRLKNDSVPSNQSWQDLYERTLPWTLGGE